jgi:HK97 family phage major capsid protein
VHPHATQLSITGPTGTPVWTQLEVKCEKLAHWIKVTDEALVDSASFERVLREELLKSLIHSETGQLLSGNGKSPQLMGLLNASGILTRARGTDSNLDAILKGLTDLAVGASFTTGDLCVLHPSNWETIRLTKASGSGEYLLGSPLAAVVPTIGTARVYLTTRMPSGTGLLLNSREAVRVFVRERPGT